MIKIIQLESGVRLILENMPSIRSSCIGIWCNNGSSNEMPEQYGISHFIEHMLFKGTKNRTAFEIVQEIDSVGGEINAFTGKESTCFYVKCLDEHFFKACDVLTDMIENPLFEQTELDKEKKVIIEEINMNLDDPDDVALEEYEKLVFNGSGMAHPVLGLKETINTFNHDFLMDYYEAHYSRDSIIVSVAGSFDEKAVIDYFSKHFYSLKEHAVKVDRGHVDYKAKNINIIKDIEQAHICMGIPSLTVDSKDRYKLSILNTLLGGSMSSRLFQHIREKLGLAYAVYSSTSLYILAGFFLIYAGVNKDKSSEAIQAIKQELRKLASEEISENEFLSAKEQLKSSYIFSQESVKSRMISNGRNLLALGKCPTQDEILEKIDKVTLEEIENIRSLICDIDNYSTVTVTGK